MRRTPTTYCGGSVEGEAARPVRNAKAEITREIENTIKIAIQERAVPSAYVSTLPSVVLCRKEGCTASGALLDVRRTQFSQTLHVLLMSITLCECTISSNIHTTRCRDKYLSLVERVGVEAPIL